MPLLRRWWTKTYDLDPQVKIKNVFTLVVHEGLFTDENELHINDVPILYFEAGVNQWSGFLPFRYNDKPYEFCFNYSAWSGNPNSAIVLQNNRILAQYGNSTALDMDDPIKVFHFPDEL